MENGYDEAVKTDFYELTSSAALWQAGMHGQLATFGLFGRSLPETRNYSVAAGLADAVRFLQNFGFSGEQVGWLATQTPLKRQPEEFFEFLRGMRFTGDVWAMPEGTPFFGNEPLAIVRAPVCEALVAETYLINATNYATGVASKASRMMAGARGRGLIEMGARRAPAWDASKAGARAAYLAGFIGTSNVDAAMEYGIPPMGTMSHAYVQSFCSELKAFRAFAKALPKTSIFLVDTYNVECGVQNAVTVAREMEARGEKLAGVRIDSGDLAAHARMARTMFDEAGLPYVSIVLSSDLDEYKLDELHADAPCFATAGVGTRAVYPTDGMVNFVYKLCEKERDGGMVPCAKASAGKVNLPGLQQVYRHFGADKRAVKDEICLAEEARDAMPLLHKVMEDGVLLAPLPTLTESRDYCAEQLDLLPQKLRDIWPCAYPVEVSPKLQFVKAHVLEGIRETVAGMCAANKVKGR